MKRDTVSKCGLVSLLVAATLVTQVSAAPKAEHVKFVRDKVT